jgi:hypothetical protein
MLRRILGQNKNRAGEKGFPSASDKFSLLKGEGLGEGKLLTGQN